jgi:hypothetical protein
MRGVNERLMGNNKEANESMNESEANLRHEAEIMKLIRGKS